jgi:hypothetical protein
VSRQEGWRKVLDLEVKRWSAMSAGQLIAALSEGQAYELELDAKTYQVEVELLQNTGEYVHVMVGVDDGSLPRSILPVTASFICAKRCPAG